MILVGQVHRSVFQSMVFLSRSWVFLSMSSPYSSFCLPTNPQSLTYWVLVGQVHRSVSKSLVFLSKSLVFLSMYSSYSSFIFLTTQSLTLWVSKGASFVEGDTLPWDFFIRPNLGLVKKQKSHNFIFCRGGYHC